jgi:hypothetical protein
MTHDIPLLVAGALFAYILGMMSGVTVAYHKRRMCVSRSAPAIGRSTQEFVHELDHWWHDRTPPGYATHMSILVVDVMSFTDPARNLLDQRTVHDRMHEILRQALDESGVPPQAC